MKTKRNKRVEQKRRASNHVHAPHKLRHTRMSSFEELRFSVIGFINKHRRRPKFVEALLRQDETVRSERLRHLEAAFGISDMTEQYAVASEASASARPSLPSLIDGRTNYGYIMAAQRIRRRSM